MLKIRLLFSLFFFLACRVEAQPLQSQNITKLLSRADSLFDAGQAEPAYQLYRQIREQGGHQSPQQLLRMAYVQEGRNQYPAALYYLSLAQAGQPRQDTWRKMAALAQEHRLTGYPDTWRQSLTITFRRYYNRLLQGLLVVAVVAGTLLLVRRRTAGRAWWTAYGAYLAATAVFLNLLAPPRVGLVARSHAALMAGPSAGAAWLTTAAAGDRFAVQGKQDIWYRVRWKGQDAYIRTPDLVLID
ncbi:SH3 domain-containing protein [Hymenobacter mucosus]|uniref:SH3 domain-containing protein n=1 Tax=Hymenobacter mucosus TaxID=1411120 RepID=UPI000B777AA5|nr:SH3 domain-containing protein [Hymenobacter mucosus]